MWVGEWLCNTLQHTATHCNTLQHPATPRNTPQHTATHCSTPQHTTTHCTVSTSIPPHVNIFIVRVNACARVCVCLCVWRYFYIPAGPKNNGAKVFQKIPNSVFSKYDYEYRYPSVFQDRCGVCVLALLCVYLCV